MWPFKSKYDKIKRDDVIDAIVKIEQQSEEIETKIEENTRKIAELKAKGTIEKSKDIKLLLAKKIIHLQGEIKELTKRGQYILFNIKVLNQLKDKIDSNEFFANTAKDSLNKLLYDQRGLSKFLSKSIDKRTKVEGALVASDEKFEQFDNSYIENEAIYGVNESEEELLGMFETEEQLNMESAVITEGDLKEAKQEKTADIDASANN